MKTKEFYVKTIIFIFFGMIIESALCAQEVSDQLKFYAVNSVEGLRVRSEPSLKGKKIGLFEYQETVECLSLASEKVVLDNINANWYKVRSADKKLEGYVFGGYLTPLHSVEYFSSERNMFELDEEKLLSLVNEVKGFKTEWKVEDGLYLPSVVFIQFPTMKSRCLNDEDFGVVVKDGKIYFFNIYNQKIIFDDHDETIEIDSFFKPELEEKKATEKEYRVYGSDRSGGGSCGTVTFDGKNLRINFYSRNFGVIYRESCILEKKSSNDKIKIKYKYSFPFFANVSGTINAYSSIRNTKEADLEIRGNQRKVLEEYDGWGPLSDEGELNIVELTDYLLVDGEAFYKGIYRGKEVFIKYEDLTAQLFFSKEFMDEKIWSEWGM